MKTLVTCLAVFLTTGIYADEPNYVSKATKTDRWKPALAAAMAKPVKISFKFRTLATNPASKDHHWGVSFEDAEGNHGQLYSRGTGLCCDMKTPLGNWLIRGQVTAQGVTVPIRPNAEWATFELKATHAAFAVRYNGEYATMENRDILPLKNFEIYNYNTALEIKDFRAEPIADAVATEIPEPTFRASFDGTFDAFGADGGKIEPLARRAAAFADGVTGKSLVFTDAGFGGDNPHLVYPISNAVSSVCGGVMAWVKHPAKKGAPVRFLNDKDETMLSLQTDDDWAHVQVAMDGGKSLGFVRRVGQGAKRADDWFHLAFTWRPDGVALLFVDGIPFSAASAPGERFQWPVVGNRLGEITKVRFEKYVRGADMQNYVSDVRVYHRVIGHKEVDEAYRRGMPVDLVFNDAVYPADVPMQVIPTIAPGGHYRRPQPYEDMELKKAVVDVKMTIKRYVAVFGDKKDPKNRTGWAEDPVEGGVSEYKFLNVDKPQNIPCEQITLPAGTYALVCEVFYRRPDDGGVSHYTRTLCFDVTESTDFTSIEGNKEQWKLGEKIVERVFDKPSDMEFHGGPVEMRETAAGRYLEAGSSGGNRVSTAIHFNEKDLGNPCVLEVEWPDDKMRIMGLYMHKHSPKGAQNRDRLQCGIQAGDSYPNTGKMQKSRFYYFPSTVDMLFEVRTLVADRPGAVRAFRIWRIDELPKLKVLKPAGFKARTFGHMDEDQTVDNNFNPEFTHRNSAKTTEEILKYYNYTGQNALHYALARYWFTLGPVEGAREYFMYPTQQGELGSTISTLGKNGVNYYGRIYMRNSPHGKRYRETGCKYFERGWMQVDKEGNLAWQFDKDCTCNIGNPELQDAYIDYFADFVQRYSTRGMAGVDYDLAGFFGCFMSLNYGYDDYCVSAFQRDSGIKLPADCAVPELVNDRLDVTRAPTPKSAYPKRYAFLTDTNSTVRAAWLTWRAGQVTGFVKKLARRLREANPDFDVFIKVDTAGMGANAQEEFDRQYVQMGIDVPALLKIPGVKIGVSRGYTGHAWNLFRGLDQGDTLDRIYDAKNPVFTQVKAAYGAWPMAASSGAYFETFTKTLDDVNYKSYFQDQDVKPWGRYFLKEPAFCIGVGDMLNYQIGDQPPGMLGAEDETREFCQAYCSLPAVPFTDMGGVSDPIAGRYLVTKKGTYFYVVNMHYLPMTAVLSGKVKAMDLSSEKTGSFREVELKPFQLRSFFIAGEAKAFGPLAVEFPDGAAGSYDVRIAEIEKALAALEKIGFESAEVDAALSASRAAISSGRFCEAHRQLYLQPVEKMFIAYGNIENATEQKRDRDQGIVRVDCGSKTFTRAGGRLFSPDQEWDGKTYGYVGKTMRTSRDTTKMNSGTECLKVYETECYDVDGYRFKLEPGKYAIRVFTRCGWEPDWRPNWWLFNLTANGISLAKPLDLYAESGGDMQKAVVTEGVCTVGADGVLDLVIEHVPGSGRDSRGQPPDKTVRLVNAIEIGRK